MDWGSAAPLDFVLKKSAFAEALQSISKGRKHNTFNKLKNG